MIEGGSAYEKGAQGEQAALEYLIKRGMTPLARRYRSPFGEIDLVMLDGDVVAFIEVKARPRGGAFGGLWAITPKKRKRMIKTAMHYVSKHGCGGMLRFDAIEITSQGVIYIKNAFSADQ